MKSRVGPIMGQPSTALDRDVRLRDIPIARSFSINAPLGAGDAPDADPASLSFIVAGSMFSVIARSLEHPRGKRIRRRNTEMTLSRVVDILCQDLGPGQSLEGVEDTYGYSITWFDSGPNDCEALERFLVVARVFPTQSRCLLGFTWGELELVLRQFPIDSDLELILREIDDAFTAHVAQPLHRLRLDELAVLTRVQDQSDIGAVAERLKESSLPAIPNDWLNGWKMPRKRRVGGVSAPDAMLIASYDSWESFRTLLKLPKPTADDAIAAGARLLISLVTRSSDVSNDTISLHTAALRWLGPDVMKVLDKIDPNSALALRAMLATWAADAWVPRHPMGGMIAGPKRARRELCRTLLADLE